MSLQPVVLEGHHVRLEPLVKKHLDDLCDVVADGELWKLFVTLVPKPEDIMAFYERACSDFEAGIALPFVTIDQPSNKVIGSTRFMRYHHTYKSVEIGYTFLAQSWQRTAANTEAKLLMLNHAFETLGLNRVEFLTDFLNAKSRTAIARLGAKEEGVLRSHMVMPDGRVRDSVIFSIIKNEWPGVQQNLRSKL